MKKLLLTALFFLVFFSTSIAQKSLTSSPQKASFAQRASPTCPLSVSIQGNIKIDFLSEDNGWIVSQAPNTNQSFLKKVSTPQCSTIPKVMTNICCSTFETIKSGSWIDPATWSCNRAPTATDDVIINTGHIITNTVGTIRAKSLNYRGGQLQLSPTSNLVLGN